MAYQHVREAPPRPSDLNPAISEELDRVILHSLAKDRETRYQSAAEFRGDLENLRSGRPVLAPAAVLHQAVEPGRAAATEALSYPTTGQPMTRPMTDQGARAPEGGFGQLQMPVSGDTYAAPADYGTGQYGEYDHPRDADVSAEPSGGSGRNAGFVLLGLVSIGVLAAVAYLVYSLLGGTTTQVTVPVVKGLSQDEATTKLSDVGLKAEVSQEPSEAVPENLVISSDPAAGQQVESDSTVSLVVSTGSANAQVPDVTGLTQDQARAEIEKAGLKVGSTETVDSAKIDKDRVVSTDPKATTACPEGQPPSSCWCPAGRSQVPDVVGKSISEATKILNDLGLSVNQQQEQSDQAEGTVLSQDLTPNTKVEAGAVDDHPSGGDPAAAGADPGAAPDRAAAERPAHGRRIATELALSAARAAPTPPSARRRPGNRRPRASSPAAGTRPR